jgi:hypothetical protein
MVEGSEDQVDLLAGEATERRTFRSSTQRNEPVASMVIQLESCRVSF